jgi:general secretion pathway protein A
LSIDALEELRLLSNFQLGSHPLLQTLLLGQPEFRVTLLEHPDLEQLRQRVIATHHLEGMETAEVQAYVEHRLKCVGWTGNPAFAPAIFADLHAASGGVPRRINQIVNRLLLLGAIEEAGSLDSAMLAQVVAELAGDGTLAPAHTRGPPMAQADRTALALMAHAFAERDAQIAEMQQALIELAGSVEMRNPVQAEGTPPGMARLQERIDVLEGRLIEQDRIIRHTLTMLIEWIEADQGPRAVA